MPHLVPVAAYRVDRGLVEALDARLGPPLDSYYNGWQVWLEPAADLGIRLEWRLHPPARFRMPRGVNPHDLFEVVLIGVAGVTDDPAEAFPAGREQRRLADVWEMLEVFPADGDDVEPAAVAAAAESALGRAADASGLVDHQRMGEEWKARRGDYSVAEALFAALAPKAP